MNTRLLDRIAHIVALSGVMLVLIAGLLYGAPGALGAFVGAVVANLNWMAIRWLTTSVARQDIRRKNRLMALLGFKTVAVLGICWLLLTRLGLDAHGFVIGVSALVIGVVVGPLTLSDSADESPQGAD